MKIIKITKSGYLYIFITIFLGFAAINTGNNLVYLITSALLGFMGISGFFGKKNIYQLQLSIKFPEEIYAKREFPLKIEIKNLKKFFPSFLIKVELENNKILFPFIGEDVSEAKFLNFKFNKRGINSINNIYISSVFPFNFFIRYNVIKENFEKIVFPEPLKLNDILLFENNNKNIGMENVARKGISGDIVSIREYINDPLRSIHWKASAKRDNLMVKEFSSERENIKLIEFEKINYPDFEKKLSFLTYTIISSFKHNQNVFLKIDGKIIKNKIEMLNTIALL